MTQTQFLTAKHTAHPPPSAIYSCPVTTGVCGSGVFALVDLDDFFIFLLDFIDFLFRDDFERFIFFFCRSSVLSAVVERLRSLNLSPLLSGTVDVLSSGGDVEMAVDPEYSDDVLADFLCL